MENKNIESQIEDLEIEQNEIEDSIEEFESWVDDDITYGQAMKWKDDLKKASKKIAELKNQLKTKTNTSDSDLVTKTDLAIDKFIVKNPDLEDYKDELNKYVKMWFSLDKAKLLVENDDKTIENRRKSNSLNLTTWETTWKKTYTTDDLEKMSQSDYNRIMDLKDKWKVTIKR